MTQLYYIAKRPCGCVEAAMRPDRMSRDTVAAILGDWWIRGLTIDRTTQPVTVTATCEHDGKETQP